MSKGMSTQIQHHEAHKVRPSPAEIAAVIEKIKIGDWIDPEREPIEASYWFCTLYEDTGQRVGDGLALTAGEAMSLAWVCAMAPDALIENYVAPGEVPYEIPGDWRFELQPPQEPPRPSAALCCSG